MTPGNTDFALADALEAYVEWQAQNDGSRPLLPAGFQRLVETSRANRLRPGFVEGLAAKLTAAANQVPPASRPAAPHARRSVRLAVVASATAVALAAAVGLFIVSGNDGAQPVDAAGIIAQARQATAAADAQSPRTFTMTVRHTMWANLEVSDGEFRDRILHRVELRRWVQQPDHWRSELWFFSFDEDGNPNGEEQAQILVGDGTTTWIYDRGSVEQRPSSGEPSDNTSLRMGTVSDGLGGNSIDEILQNAAACHHPELAGTETIDGRATYVIELGEDRCAPPMPSGAHRYEATRVWIDAETFLARKWLSFSDSPNTWVVSEVAELDLAPTIDPAVFEFEAP